MISIIMPVYNSGCYLRRSVDSILNQSYADWELLLIDDGSNDGSGELCDMYARTDTRIKVFHQENKGVAAARQVGIEQATGDYSIHVDSDDWIEQNMLEEMLAEANKGDADVLVADFYMDKGTASHRISQKPGMTNDRCSLVSNILTGKLHGSLCNKLIRHGVYTKYALGFVAGINLCEDALFCIRLFQCPIRYAYMGKAFYHYVDNGQASMARHYDRRMYVQIKSYLETALHYCPSSTTHLLADKIRHNELIAMLHGITDAESAYHKGFRLSLRDIATRHIGPEGRFFVLMYLIGATKICTYMNKKHLLRI